MGKDYYKNPSHKKKGNLNKLHNKPSTKKSVEDCCFCIGSVNRVSDHDDTSKFVVNQKKKTCIRGNDMSEALRKNGKPDMSKWEPALEFEDSTETVDNTRLSEQHELKHKIEHDVCLKRKETCRQNIHKAYVELWECYATAMKGNLEARTTFESVTCNNTIVLVKEIKEHSLCFEESRCEIAKFFDAIKQKEQGK